ncbi:carboxymuconolactone decarboxylase family protein [Streptomyces sp. NPDC090119]|uniref:carboxymuconolactone decarboxylase family protein n=1 Tax=Streptomyces sp. NPDC090119 TaxID=3365951 RepID=UPI003804E283
MTTDLPARTSHAIALLREASPANLDGFLLLNEMFESTTLDPHSRETVVLAVATRNQCHLCVDMHQDRLTALGPAENPERLDAVHRFTLQVLASSGAVSEEELTAFQAHGYTRRNALEVVLGIGAYTLSTFSNRLVGAA